MRSEIIFCRLAKASPPDKALCFLVAASTAASMAVRGADTGAVIDRVAGAGCDNGLPGSAMEIASCDDGLAVTTIGFGRRGTVPDVRRFCSLPSAGESARDRASPLTFLFFALPTLSGTTFGPRLVPPLIVVVVPLFLSLPPPSLGAREE